MIFTQRLGTLDGMSAEKAVRTLANYVRAMQEQLEYTLTTLDSDNIVEIDTDRTAVASSSGGTATADGIRINGSGGASFRVERGSSGGLTLRMTAADGRDIIFASSGIGQVDLRSRTSFYIDGGSWDQGGINQ